MPHKDRLRDGLKRQRNNHTDTPETVKQSETARWRLGEKERVEKDREQSKRGEVEKRVSD